jgi:hypothetical protein
VQNRLSGKKTEKLLSCINNKSFYRVIFMNKKAKARDKKGMAKRRDVDK